ncbi:SF1B family DNA helicase RecD2 [Azospirillum soli]|uniref:SF1B family DNA helicase RecD2 n=1 Tax=Azospirillum soli TaxID=1304799 RepID=UPI001FE47580|nr:ATP-dependent RecD-like DNA helicase [Azospirillum soli]MBP2312136.1 exodeoxyribonuclease V alpha subunit [Azospirillum soli]
MFQTMSLPAQTDATREPLSGLVERVTFHSPETGFCVLRVKVRGQRDLVTVVGHAASISAGEFVQAAGAWVNDRNHGLQFKADFLRATPPTTAEGIEKYLGSGLIKGIGPVYAKKLVKAFGDAVFDVIEQEPDKLLQVTGIGPKRAQRIIAGWADQKVIREIMVFLHSHGVGTSRAVRIFKTYGPDAIQLITENPYRLARDIRGIGFKTADAVAARLGIEKTAMIRARAGITYALAEATDQGHCGLPTAQLIPLAAKLLEIDPAIIEDALALELKEGTVVADTLAEEPCVFLTGLYRAEQAISDRLRRLASGRVPWPPIDAAKAIPWAEEKAGITLADSQREALRQALSSKLLVITGGPGVGKTTLVNSILTILKAKDVSIALAAPTGRAAKRLSESTGMEAKTIHRLLETDPQAGGFKRDETNPLDCDLLVVDETSMVDVPLMNALLRAVPPRAALLLVGDVDQLPSVGPGQVLGDVIGCGAVPVVRLTEIFRQAATSRIIVNAHRINAGHMPDWPKAGDESDFYFVEAATPEIGIAKLIEIVRGRIPRRFGFDPVRDVQILCPMNRGGMGARSLNIELQRVLNPPVEPRVERFGWTFGVGDKVMQIENDYDKEVYNGDLGIVSALDPEEGTLTAEFDGRPVTYDYGELDEIVLAYATTIHKSQGSEYPVVIIPVMTQHYTMLHRNLIYTGVTRGKRLVVMIGQRKALAMAVRGTQGRRRWSKLGEWLADV